jgi:hypothetical protein
MSSRQVRQYLDLERKILFLGQRLNGSVNGLHDRLERIIGECEDKLARLYLRHVEYVVDQAKQVPSITFNPFQHSAHFLWRITVDAVEDQLSVAENGIERCAQFVAHVGEELRLMFARY